MRYIQIRMYAMFPFLFMFLQGVQGGGGGLADVDGAQALEGGGRQEQRRHHTGVEQRGHAFGHR